MNATFSENDLSSEMVLPIAASSVNTILGVPLNGYVMWLIVTRKTLASDFFSLNLAVSEIFFSLSSIWFFLYALLRTFFCLEAFIFSLGLFYTARPLFQCCICVECYVGVVHPVLFLRFKPLRYRVTCCCIAWLIALASCLYSIYTFTNPLYLYGIFIQSVLFITVMLFCCLSVLWALKRPRPGEKATEKQKSNKMKRRAFKIILLIMISMTISFFLYMVVISTSVLLDRVFRSPHHLPDLRFSNWVHTAPPLPPQERKTSMLQGALIFTSNIPVYITLYLILENWDKLYFEGI